MRFAGAGIGYELHGNAFDGETGHIAAVAPMLTKASTTPGQLLVYVLDPLRVELGKRHYRYDRTVSTDDVNEDGTVS